MFQRIAKAAAWFGLTLIVVGVSFYSWLRFSEAAVESLPSLKTGDLVFQTTTSSQATAIVLASASPYSHMGIVNVAPSGKATVIEAIGPVREIPLQRWLTQGLSRRLTIKRMKGLDPRSATRIIEAARAYRGLPYDFYFLFGNKAIYCSELAWLAFKDAAGLRIGKVQAVGDLHVRNSAVTNLIKRRWQNYAPCTAKGITKFETCYKLVMKQKLVTPASIAEDPRMELIYSNYPTLDP